MKPKGTRSGLVAVALFWAGWMAFTSTSSATLPMQKKAKELGITSVTDCMFPFVTGVEEVREARAMKLRDCSETCLASRGYAWQAWRLDRF